MTNPALDALDILWSDKANAHLSYEELKAAYDTIRTALSNAPQWQTIDTAPKDGTKVLLWDEPVSPVPTIDHKGFMRVGRFEPDGIGFNCMPRRHVTKWQPLPTAPQADSKNGGAE